MIASRSNPDPTLLPGVIRAVRGEYAARGYDAYAIGNGLCDDFAREVLERWIGEDWIMHEGDGFDTLETLNLIHPETGDWDWPLLARHWGATPPADVDPKTLTMVAHCQPSHVWITVGRRHHDVESPEGVDSFLDLMFFRRWLGLAPKGVGVDDA